MKEEKGRRLIEACKEGAKEEALDLIKDPSCRINERDSKGRCPLFYACQMNHVGILRSLLSRKDLHVNQEDETLSTPFLAASRNGHVEVIKILLSSQRADILKGDRDGKTPLWWACFWGHKGVVELLLSSSQNLPTRATPFKGTLMVPPALVARRRNFDGIAALLQSYEANPFMVNCRLRREFACDGALFVSFLLLLLLLLSLSPSFLLSLSFIFLTFYCPFMIVDIFAMVSLLSDEYLKIAERSWDEKERRAVRFFLICQSLPFELVMVLVRRVYLGSQTFFLSSHTEAALKRVLALFESHFI